MPDDSSAKAREDGIPLVPRRPSERPRLTDRRWATYSAPERRDQEWNDARTDPLDVDTRLSFKSYVALQRAVERQDGSVSPNHEERLQGYREYRAEFQRRTLWNFFLEHHDDTWFREKYDPDAHFAALRTARRRAGRRGTKAKWLAQLRSGELDCVNNDLHPGETLYTVVSRSGATEHFDSDVLFIPPDTERQLLVRSCPPELAREELEAYLSTYPGFRYVAMLEPIAQRNWVRAGIAVFEEGNDMRKAASVLDGKSFGDFVLHISVIERPSSSRLRIAPGATNGLARLERDIRQAQQLIVKFENEDTLLFEPSERVDVSICDAVDARCAQISTGDYRDQLKLRLDLLLDALRFVYHCDYYLGLAVDLPEELERRTSRHVRRQTQEPDSEECIAHDAWWTEHLDRKISLLIHPDAETLKMCGAIDVEQERDALSRPFIRQEGENFRCHIDVGGRPCSKLFNEYAYAKQHITNKHLDALGESSIRLELAEFFNNYLSDPMRVAPTQGTCERRMPSRREPRRRDERSMSMPIERPVMRLGARSSSSGPMAPPTKPPLAQYIDSVVASAQGPEQPKQYRDLDGGAPQHEQDLPY